MSTVSSERAEVISKAANYLSYKFDFTSPRIQEEIDKQDSAITDLIKLGPLSRSEALAALSKHGINVDGSSSTHTSPPTSSTAASREQRDKAALPPIISQI